MCRNYPNDFSKSEYGSGINIWFASTGSIIESDKNRLTQIITNFINNALKFTSSGSITLSYTVSHNFIKFSVTDTGIGIPPKNKKIFLNDL